MPKSIYVIAHHPDQVTSQQQGDPPAAYSAYLLESDKDATITSMLEQHASEFPIGTELIVVDASKATTYSVKPQVVMGKASG